VRLGAPISAHGVEDFVGPDTVFQRGLLPNRVEILTETVE
jgi:hypothetical protein